ncbi:MAG: thiamine pyrophosphate-binding protein, partial [Pseudomonadota bacterium]
MTKTAPIRAADALARRLHSAGCRYAFGMPGGEVLTLVDALEAAGIRFILAKHENAAAFMAEGVHHQTGAPAILVATVGPGALNGVNAVANAHQDRVPMIVLAGAVDPDEVQTYTHQVLDQQAVFRPITKASISLVPGAAHVIADKAVGISTEGRPGPVHIDVPISVADAPVAAAPPPARAAAAPTVPAGGALAEAKRWLAEARRPVIVAGVDAMNESAGPALTAFAERFGTPVITTYKAKGLLAEDHALALGGAGLSPLADSHLMPLVQAADLVLCVGYDPIEMRTGWRNPWSPDTQRVIDITAEPNHHYMHQAGISVIGNCAATLEALSVGADPQVTWPDDMPQTVKRKLAEAFPTDDDWGPAAVIDTCRAVLPRDTVATADSGAHRILL